MNFAVALEWVCWLLAPLTVFLYGQSQMRGAACGVLTVLLFIAWGLVAGIPAASLTNLIFVALHGRNLWRAVHADTQLRRPARG